MIQIKYKPLFDIEVLHNFYTSGKCLDLEVMPSHECQALMQYLGLRFLPTPSGGKVFARVATVAGKDIIKNPLPENTRFSFLLKLKKNLFENFTDLNLSKPKTSHYYFNNLVNNISSGGFPLLVVNAANKIVSDADLLPFTGNNLSYVHSSTAAKQDSELQFIDRGESFQQSLDNNNDVFNFSYSLIQTPGGRAKLFIEGAEKAFIYVTTPDYYKDVFGAIEIFYKSSLPAACQFQQTDNSIETKLYKIAFSRRSTKWRYVVTKKFNQAITGITIAKTNGTSINFTEQAGAPSGQFIWASNNVLPLQEEPVSGIKLSDQSDKVIITHLPNPSLMLVKTEGPDTFSDILITI